MVVQLIKYTKSLYKQERLFCGAQCVYFEVAVMMLLAQAFQISQNILTLVLSLLVDVLFLNAVIPSPRNKSTVRKNPKHRRECS